MYSLLLGNDPHELNFVVPLATKNRNKNKRAKKIMGKGYSGGYNNHQKSVWYQQNIKMLLGNIASGIGPKDIEYLFTFIGFPIPSSFPYDIFPKIENLIGENIQKVSNRSMINSLREEVEAETRKKYCEWLKTKTMGICVSYDIWERARGSVATATILFLVTHF